MELIHIANATFSSLRINHLSLENLASKQKLFRIVKEQTMRSSASPQITRRIARSRQLMLHMCSRHHASVVCRGGADSWWSQPGSNRRPPACKAGALPAELWPPRSWAKIVETIFADITP